MALAATAEALRARRKVLVLVPTLELQRQWHMAVKGALPGVSVHLRGDGHSRSLRHCDVLISTVHSAQDQDLLPPEGEGLLVADEVHRYGAPKFSRALNPRFSWRLGLTATYERNDEGLTEHLEPYFRSVCAKVDYAEAVPAGYVSRFKLALVGAQLTAMERADYDEFDGRFRKAYAALVSQGQLKPDPFGEFMKAVTQISEGGHPLTVEARKFLSAFAGRRRILAESTQKLERLRSLVPAIQSANRALVFSQTVQAADDARDLLGQYGVRAASLHSQSGRDERADVMERFRRNRLHVVTAAQVLDEGIDVPEADLAVILAATQTRRQMIQRVGRVLRRKNPPRLARVVMMYAEGTPEDPNQGGHAPFLTVAMEVADAVEAFPSSTPDAPINTFLNDAQIRGPVRTPRVQPVDIHGVGTVATTGEFEESLPPVTEPVAKASQPRRAARRLQGPANRAKTRPRTSHYAPPDIRDTSRQRHGWSDFEKKFADLWEAMTGQNLDHSDLLALGPSGWLLSMEAHCDRPGWDVVEAVGWRVRKGGDDFLGRWMVELERYAARGRRSESTPGETRLAKQPGLPDIEEDAQALPQTSYRSRTGLPPVMLYGDDTG